MESIARTKSFTFALKTIELYKYLVDEHRECVMAKQLFRSGTSIGAHLKESEHAQSKSDFLHKVNIALKEANETEYWLELLKASSYISENKHIVLLQDISELIKILSVIVKTTKKNLGKL